MGKKSRLTNKELGKAQTTAKKTKNHKRSRHTGARCHGKLERKNEMVTNNFQEKKWQMGRNKAGEKNGKWEETKQEKNKSYRN